MVLHSSISRSSYFCVQPVATIQLKKMSKRTFDHQFIEKKHFFPLLYLHLLYFTCVTCGNVDGQHHTMTRPLLPPAAIQNCSPPKLCFFSARGCRRARPMGICGCPQRWEWGTTAAAAEYFLHGARCIAMRGGEH